MGNGETSDGRTHADARDAEALAVNARVAEWMASLVKDEHLKLLGADKAQILDNARREVRRRGAVETLALNSGAPLRLRRPKMETEQVAEWLRCAILRSQGVAAEPDPELDADGVISGYFRQSLGSALGTAGGYTVPDDFRAEVYAKADEPAVVWPLLRRRPASSDTVKSVEVTGYVTVSKGTSAKSTSATTTDEVTVTEPTYGELTWNMRAFDARVPIKLDLLEDTSVNLLDHVTDLVADGFAVEHEREPIIGTGSAGERPVGLFNAEAGIPTTSIGDNLTKQKFLDFLKEIPQRYRIRASCLLNTDAYFYLVNDLVTNVRAAQYMAGILEPSRIRESAYVPDGKIIGGDFNYYAVYYRNLMKMVSTTVAERWTLEMVFQERWDGKPTITDAFRIGTGVTYS